MSFSGYNSTRPRSILVIVGGVVAWVSMAIGGWIVTPLLNQSMVMKRDPVEMTWQEWVEKGLTDNAHVRLTHVQMSSANPLDDFEGMRGTDESEQKAMFLSRVGGDLDPLLVIAETETTFDKSVERERVVVPMTVRAIEAAYAEIATSGTLTGRFTRTRSTSTPSEPEGMLASLMSSHVFEKVGKASTQWHYEFEPVGWVPPFSDAIQWFVLSSLAVAVGLVVCGAGGPSVACCVFFQPASLLSVLGYPMRYGAAARGLASCTCWSDVRWSVTRMTN